MFSKFVIVALLGVSVIGSVSAQTTPNTQAIINAIPRNFCSGALQEWVRAPDTLRILEMNETRVVRAVNAAPRGSGLRIFVHETMTCEPDANGSSVVVRFSWAPARP